MKSAKRKKRFNGLLLVLVITLFACQSQQYLPDQLPQRQLVFGSGGGFSGEVNEYIMLENGQVFKKNSREKLPIALSEVKRRQAKRFFKQLDEINFTDKVMDEPGNMYYFIRYIDEEVNHRVVWGGTSSKMNMEVNKMYRELMELIK